MDVMKAYGGNTYNQAGRTYLTLVKAFIIFGPDGTSSIDIQSHELSHVELATRIGYRQRKMIPNWFDKGLALQFDNRYTEIEWQRRTENGRIAPELDEIGTIRHNDWLAYATAKHEVKRFLDIVGQEGLHELLLAIRKGDAFQEAYHSMEQARSSDM
jgi:hypothetical protein